MCELRTYLATRSYKRLYSNAVASYASGVPEGYSYIGNYSTKNSSTCVDVKA